MFFMLLPGIISVAFFAFIYMFLTMNLGEAIGQDSIRQLNYGLIIGILVWISYRIEQNCNNNNDLDDV